MTFIKTPTYRKLASIQRFERVEGVYAEQARPRRTRLGGGSRAKVEESLFGGSQKTDTD